MSSAIDTNSKKIRIENLVVHELSSLDVTSTHEGNLDLRQEAKNQSNHSNQRIVGNESSNEANRLDDAQQTIDDPVGEPLGVVVLVVGLDRLKRGIHGIQEHDEVAMDEVFSSQNPTLESCSPE